MNQFVNEFVSAVLQVLVFTLIPFLFFLIRKDKAISFSEYIGFYKTSSKAITYSVFTSLIFLATGIGLVFIDEGFKQIVLSPISVTGKIRALGFTATSVSILILIAVIKTSLSEEILFRGFIAKRLIAALGVNTGNILQALIFGAVHLLLVWRLINPSPLGLILITCFSTVGGWVIGYIKEKFGNGSIIPGWIAHGLGNLISYTIIAYIL
jgi:membrane protease YdiL (CAAX protease family)